MKKYEAVLNEFSGALARFEDVLRQEKTEFIRDSAIKRFEIVFDLSWKAIKARLEEEGIMCFSPMNCFKEAYRAGLIEYEEVWLDMITTRNKTVHTYDLNVAEEVYSDLPNNLKAFQKLLEYLKK